MTRQRLVFLAALLLLTAGALALHLPSLENRPFHADEAVHAVKFRELWERGVYRYDPDEFHGPTLYYAALPVVALRGRADFAATREADYRLSIALFGAATLLLLALLADGLGRPAALVAAGLMALSPACVFYSRYYIQETLLTFFTLGSLACGWRYTRKPSSGWAIWLGVCGGLMLATKETAVLSFAAATIACVVTARHRPALNRTHVALAVGVALIVACLLLSGFGYNPAAPLDYLRSYIPWLNRAGGTDLHRHPWHYYLRILLAKETLIVGLALVGTWAAFSRRGSSLLPDAAPGFLRFVAVYTLVLTAAYSAIPYKTPWCVLSFLSGMILLAGAGTISLIRLAPGRVGKAIVGLLLAVGVVHLGGQAYRASFIDFADGRRNPYAYSPTAPEVAELGRRIEDLARAHPDREKMVVKVFARDAYYWPLPWTLRRLPNVGYWTGSLPDDVNAPVVIASPEFDEALTHRLDATHLMTGFYGLRPTTLLQVWVRLDLWENYLKTRKPVPEQDFAPETRS